MEVIGIEVAVTQNFSFVFVTKNATGCNKETFKKCK
jgi:hypothetical protein